MSITGTQISTSAGILLHDDPPVRWLAAERLTWINDGRREMFALKPEVFGNGTEIAHNLTTGCKQRISTSGAWRLVSVDSHGTTGVRPTTKEQLDAFKPAWRADTATAVQNWFSDPTDPLAFWVYPASTGEMRCHVHITPTDLASLTETALPNDLYATALVNYLCYRALAKEDEAGVVAKAQAYFQLFTAALTGA